MPQEFVFGAFLATAWGATAVRFGPRNPNSLAYAGLLLLDGWLVFRCWRQASPIRWRARLLFHALAIHVVYFHLKGVVPRLGDARWDGVLNGMDSAVLGATPALSLKFLRHPALTELFSACYLFFFPYLVISLIRQVFGNLALARRFMAGLGTIYGLGYFGYLLFPATGPWVALAPGFEGPLHGGWITECNAAVVRFGSIGVDVFPSLHCAVSAFILGFDARHHRRRFWICLLPCVGLWGSTVYLGYHYAVDVVCGFVLAALGLFLAESLREDPSVGPG